MVNLLDNAVTAVSRGAREDRGEDDLRAGPPAGPRRGPRQRDRRVARRQGEDVRALLFDKKSGSGLGLAIVSSIISEHRGSVTVADNAPRGTVVAFELPIEQVEEQSITAGKAEG
ncbi:MAG: ATP-binding protein [Desulfosudis oleivorans]|nr:ATP-binding protein [Desulfosudis oleivorans]